MIRRYNLDNVADFERLMGDTPAMTAGALPRRSVYGKAPRLLPFAEAYPDKLVEESDYKEVIADCHEKKIFPIYHQYNTWAPPGFRWNQNGLGFCWAWGVTAALMDCMAREGKEFPLLSPVTLGWLVNWKDQGNYLESAMSGAMERGIAPMSYTPDMHSLSHNNYKEGWEDEALNYRIAEAWDTDYRNMTQHEVSILRTGTPLYIAYNWWGHALQESAMYYDDDILVRQIRNSHNEDDVIELTGDKAVPDEAYAVRASLTLGV